MISSALCVFKAARSNHSEKTGTTVLAQSCVIQSALQVIISLSRDNGICGCGKSSDANASCCWASCKNLHGCAKHCRWLLIPRHEIKSITCQFNIHKIFIYNWNFLAVHLCKSRFKHDGIVQMVCCCSFIAPNSAHTKTHFSTTFLSCLDNIYIYTCPLSTRVRSLSRDFLSLTLKRKLQPCTRNMQANTIFMMSKTV